MSKAFSTKIREEGGQAIVILALAMTVMLGMAAVAIDLASWYQKHHQAQVAADAASLAAAQCLANGSSGNTCTSTTDTADAASVATTFAAQNGVNIPTTDVTIDTTGKSVTVTTPGPAPPFFARVVGVNTTTVAAHSVASFNALVGRSFTCVKAGSSSCISLFAANNSCPSPAPNVSGGNYVGLDILTQDHGGGHSDVEDAFSNGYFYNGADAGTYTVTVVGSGSPSCSTDYQKKSGTTSFSYMPNAVPYPAVWTQPSCDPAHTATYWTTSSVAGHQIGAPGTYCVSASPAGSGTPACQDDASGMTAGFIYLDESVLASGGYEFVGPCVTIAGSNPNVTNIAGQPLVYGTSNIVTYATSSALPTCTSAANNGTAGSDVYLDGNGATLEAPVYDQCGTFESTFNNNTFVGFVEAWNISLDKNNTSALGDGPTSTSGGGVTTTPAGDSLSG